MKNRLSNIQILKKDRKRYYRGIKYPNIPLSENDLYVTTTVGDRLDLLADFFYKDFRLWWIISIANRDVVRRDSFYIKPGIEIRIPSNIQQILESYRSMNSTNY